MRRVDPPANGPSFQRLGTGFKVFTIEDLSQEAQQAKHVVWEAILRNGEVSRQLLIDNIKDIIAPCAGAEISWLGYCLWACSPLGHLGRPIWTLFFRGCHKRSTPLARRASVLPRRCTRKPSHEVMRERGTWSSLWMSFGRVSACLQPLWFIRGS